MGEINYTLLNASVLNASRLNMTGETGKPGGGAGGYWPAGTPAAIRRSAVLWYDIAKQGATNETMAENPVLKDLSGHGHDATCYNFDWAGMSGIGGYGLSFSQYSHIRQDRATIEFNGNYTTIIKSVILTSWQLYNNVSQETVIPAQKIRITGIPDGIAVRYQKRVDTGSAIILSITEDGDYDIPQFTTSDIYGFEIIQVVEECNIVIEQLPLYPNALVSDGVDDYAVVEGLPIIQSLIINANVDALPQQEGEWAYLYDSVISESGNNRFYATFNWLGSFESSPKLSDGYAENKGESSYEGQQEFFLFTRFNLNRDFGAMVFFSFLLFSRKLTSEEIEWVKNNLIENNTEE